MGLADLIQRKKTATVLSPATATLAIPATVAPFSADIPPSVATVATVAVADKKTTTIIKPQTAGKVSRQPDTFSALCESYGGHCSVKITGVCPDDCIKIGCEYKTPEIYPTGHIWHKWYETPIPTDTPRNACRCCKSTDFWQSIHGATVCRKCHPPMEGAERITHETETANT